MKKEYQPKTGERCDCKPGIHRDNCPDCEGTGWRIDFHAIRARKAEAAPAKVGDDYEANKAINLAAPNQQKRGFILRPSTERKADTGTAQVASLTDQNKRFRALIDRACFALREFQVMPELRQELWRALQESIPDDAAPDLLEALRAALERLEASQPPHNGATAAVCEQARAAIAKAERGQG